MGEDCSVCVVQRVKIVSRAEPMTPQRKLEEWKRAGGMEGAGGGGGGGQIGKACLDKQQKMQHRELETLRLGHDIISHSSIVGTAKV